MPASARFSNTRLVRETQVARNAEMRDSIKVLMGSGSVSSNRGKLAWEAEYEVFADNGWSWAAFAIKG